MSKNTKPKKTTTKPKAKNDDDYYTPEEEKRLDWFHEQTEKKFTDDEVSPLMKKYGDKWAFDMQPRKMLKQLLWQAEDYYKKREYPPDYWYYKLPDEADYEYKSEIPSFSGSTNFNKGFLKKIEAKRK